MSDPLYPIERRGELVLIDLLATDSTLAGYPVKRRDEDGVITPETETAKAIRIILKVSDSGRTVAYALIRNLHVEIEMRANAKVAAGLADPFNQACGALENLLDTTSFGRDDATGTVLALSSETHGIATMLAIRQPGNTFGVEGDLRKQSYVLELRAVKRELTIQGQPVTTFDSTTATFDSNLLTMDAA